MNKAVFPSKDSLKVLKSLDVDGKSYQYFSLKAADEALGVDTNRLPFTLKILYENLLRYEDGVSVKEEDIKALVAWLDSKSSQTEIAYRPARVLMQDFTGVPAVVDLAAMRDAMKTLGGDAQKINPLSAVDLIIDHSVQVDKFGSADALVENVRIEMERNQERYAFLRWGQDAFDNFRVVPPGTGICHQVNLEYLGQVVWTKEDFAFPDTLVGTDSHTTMINGLAILGWGVGGIEAEAAMLGQPISMVIPEVVGFELKGQLKEGTTATDLVLTVTQMLREKGVVGKFVEFYGDGLNNLPLADRATIANMAPEYGATCGFFPTDNKTLDYMRLTGRDDERIALVEAYAKAQGMWRDENSEPPIFTDSLSLDMAQVEPSIAGPKRPQDKILLSEAKSQFNQELEELICDEGGICEIHKDAYVPTAGDDFYEDQDDLANTLPDLDTSNTQVDAHIHVRDSDYDIEHGDIVIAAITSCTNTSNPSVMLGAGLVAKKALEKGLEVKPWVKTSLAPGSKVVTEYLEASGLQKDLDGLGFNLVGYGCTTCIGNSGPLQAEIEEAIKDNGLIVSSVLSGNRNFEGRVHPLTKANYLASPPLVVAYALAGSMRIDITKDPVGYDKDNNPVYLKDIWPTTQEVADVVANTVTSEMFKTKYADVFSGDESWKAIQVTGGETYDWDTESTYIKCPPFFQDMNKEAGGINDIKGARPLAVLGDSVTTDHISPAGSIAADSPAANYLNGRGIEKQDFNSYGSRRGNDEVMTRGTFANIRIRNEMVDKEGGYTKHMPSGEEMSIYDAAMKYKEEATPLVVVAGKEYGTGSSRDWAAKGTNLLGIKAVIAESYERIHRSNLIGMGVLPLVFKDGANRQSLKLDGSETFNITGVEAGLKPRMDVNCTITRTDGSEETITLLCRVDTSDEVDYVNNGGILHKVIRDLAQ